MYWKNLDKIWVIVTHLAAAFLGAFLISFLFGDDVQYQDQKLYQLLDIIENRFVEDANTTTLEDVAAYAMVKATGDQWSYYIPASQYQAHVESTENISVGVGATMDRKDDGSGLEVTELTEGGGAAEAGIQLHDVLIRVDGKSCAGIELKEVTPWIRGEEGSTVVLTVNRNGQELDFTVTRKRVEIPVATYEMLPSGYGLVTIENFEARASEETLEAIDALMEQGAKGLIFDVRFNPGGYTTELVKILDYLLPEGPLFRRESYDGQTSVDYSDAQCVDLPMAVLANESSYSAAEFFAAALQEYDAAVVVGEQTTGKGYYQNTFRLVDGSAVAISTGKYFTPKGESLAGVGVMPDVPVKLDQESSDALDQGILEREKDLQLQAAVAALEEAA